MKTSAAKQIDNSDQSSQFFFSFPFSLLIFSSFPSSHFAPPPPKLVEPLLVLLKMEHHRSWLATSGARQCCRRPPSSCLASANRKPPALIPLSILLDLSVRPVLSQGVATSDTLSDREISGHNHRLSSTASTQSPKGRETGFEAAGASIAVAMRRRGGNRDNIWSSCDGDGDASGAWQCVWHGLDPLNL